MDCPRLPLASRRHTKYCTRIRSPSHFFSSFSVHCIHGSHRGHSQHRCRRIITSGSVPHVVLSECKKPRARPADGLSDSSRAALAPTLRRIRDSDRGTIRASNDRTARSRAKHFIDWGTSKGFTDFAFEHTSRADAGEVLSAFAQEIAEGSGILNTPQPCIKTIQGYVRAAARIATTRGLPDPRLLEQGIAGSNKPTYVPLLATVFDITKKWTPAKFDECMPITIQILVDICAQASGAISGQELRASACIRDATILGSFSGSRVAEYAQSKVYKGDSFSKVPSNTASGSEGGKPLAFFLDDFCFYSGTKRLLQEAHIHSAAYIEVRFRYTKGVRNWTYRMFAAIPSCQFCPVAAGIRVVRRWRHLFPGNDTPLFCYKQCFLSKVCFLNDKQMTAAFRQSALRVYPHGDHIMQKKANSLSSKSLRVFACLCLKLAGWSEDDISYQLRWASDAVKFYVRQSAFQADAVGASLFKSALQI